MKMLMMVSALRRRFSPAGREETSTNDLRVLIGERNYEILIVAIYLTNMVCIIGVFYYGAYRILTPEYLLIGYASLLFGALTFLSDIKDHSTLLNPDKADRLFKKIQYDNIHKTKTWLAKLVILVINMVVDALIIWALIQIT